MRKFKYCRKCPSHQLISDPDPHDWFCDGDSAMTCQEVKTDGRTIAAAKRRKSKYRSDYSKFKVVSGSLSVFEVDKVQAPGWCPRKEGEKNDS